MYGPNNKGSFFLLNVVRTKQNNSKVSRMKYTLDNPYKASRLILWQEMLKDINLSIKVKKQFDNNLGIKQLRETKQALAQIFIEYFEG